MKRRCCCVGMIGLLLASARADTWQTNSGRRFEGKLSGVYGPVAVVSSKQGSVSMTLGSLGDAELGRVADFLDAHRNDPPWKQSASLVGKAVRGRLQVLREGKLVDFDPGARREPDFYLVYFGAEWCPPCRAFSPEFVEEYQRLQKLAPDRFEAVFVSSDHSGGEQLSYVKHVAMPWPVLKFSQIGRVEPLERWAGNGIPCLVVVTREGDAIFHSYHGTEYVGPHSVLRDFETFLRALDENSPGARRELHRLAVIQHTRAAAGASRDPRPYLIDFDLRRYRTLEVSEVLATLDLDEKGHVADATFTPELPAVLNYSLVQDAGNWLFLPAIENGRPVRQSVKLPLALKR